jgi:hypothetical protein
MYRLVRPCIVVAAATAAAGLVPPAMGQDNLVLFIDGATATNGAALGAWGYDPATDSAYVASFGASGTLRKITNVTSGSQTATMMVSEAQWNLYYRDGDPNTSAGTPLPGGLLLNPMEISSGTLTIPAYSRAWIIDAMRTPASGTIDASRTKRLYDYNLQMVMPNPNPGNIPTEPPYYDGRDVFTTKVTLADMNSAVNLPSNATSNVSRQFAWSGDGKSIYFTDSGTITVVGGVWKADAATGAVSRIAAIGGLVVEPAARQVAPGVDRIYIRGSVQAGTDVDGIDYIDHDGTSTSAPVSLLSGQAVRNFMETTAEVGVTAIAVDASGDLFFNVNGGSGTLGTQRRNVLRYDTQGRLSKVLAYDERDLFHTGAVGGTPNPTSNVSKMQPRTVSYQGPGGPFDLTQVMYAEQSSLNRIAGFYAFKAGDFNRDNVVDQADVAMFKQKLTLRGVPAATLDLKFDLTGNNTVDFKDVKTLQQFYDFPNGDANIDRTVNLADFNILAANFGLEERMWTQGDFNGDEIVNLQDFNILAGNFGISASGPGVTPQDWSNLAAAIPEPASLGLLSVLAALLSRGRRRR